MSEYIGGDFYEYREEEEVKEAYEAIERAMVEGSMQIGQCELYFKADTLEEIEDYFKKHIIAYRKIQEEREQ